MRAFFPTELGSYWEYQISYPPPEPSYRYWLSALKDTLLPNGRIYTEFNGRYIYPSQDPSGPIYYRVDDSLQVFMYTNDSVACPEREFVFFKLAVRDSSIWPVCTDYLDPIYPYRALVRTSDEYYPNIDLSLETKIFGSAFIDLVANDTDFYPIGSSQYRLARGVGLVRSIYESVPAIELVGAIVNGTTYGTPTSVDETNKTADVTPDPTIHIFPQPFNGLTTVSLQLSRRELVVVRVFDMVGREVKQLLSDQVGPGEINMKFDGTRLASGVYILVLQGGKTLQHARFMLLR